MIAFVDTVNMGKNGLQLDEFKIFHQNTRPQGIVMADSCFGESFSFFRRNQRTGSLRED